MAIYDVGDAIRITMNFYDLAGAAIDPTGVTLTLVKDDVTYQTFTYGVDPELTRTGVGAYAMNFTIPYKGYWSYVGAGTGAAVASEIKFFVAKE